MELLTTFNYEKAYERLPNRRRDALVARWRYRRDMEELVRRHTTDTNAAMAPVDRIQGLLHGDTN